MTIEVVIPALRQEPVERLVASLLLNAQPPDCITVVSNEVQPFSASGRVRLLRFASDEYGVGDYDVALRQNCGIWAAGAKYIVISGDDQVAPPSMIGDTLVALRGKNYIWGNHRLVDFGDQGLDEIRLRPMEQGISREKPTPPASHGYQSCYGGMFAADTEFLREFGGFDMAFNGRHAGEDQQLGYRLMRKAGRDKVDILEPPFSWHSITLRDGDGRDRASWLDPITNSCGSHEFVEDFIDGVRFLRCRLCPIRRFEDKPEKLFHTRILIPFRPEAVTTTSVWLTE